MSPVFEKKLRPFDAQRQAYEQSVQEAAVPIESIGCTIAWGPWNPTIRHVFRPIDSKEKITVRRTLFVLVVLVIVAASATSALAATTLGSLTFSNTALLRPEGVSEPEIAISSNGVMAIVGLQWLFDPGFFGTHLWTGPFGSTPTIQGLIDAGLKQPGKFVFGSGDTDVDLGSTGTLHATTLLFVINAAFNRAQIGVAAVRCPNATT